ncbi:hypothetical protein Mapa_013649 [Marchantia paleacea]|nr:hypothetical protein Mapa_013649 [Marchantia paleacea]
MGKIQFGRRSGRSHIYILVIIMADIATTLLQERKRYKKLTTSSAQLIMALCTKALLPFLIFTTSVWTVEVRAYNVSHGGKESSGQSFASVYQAGNSTGGTKSSVMTSLGHMYHANSTLVPKDCDEVCAGLIRVKRIGRYLRARINNTRRSLAAQNRASVLWLDNQKISEWYIKIAVTDTDDDDVQTVRVVPDTGSFFTWVQCRGCIKCYPQRWKLFNPRISQKYNALDESHEYCQRVQASPMALGADELTCKYKAIYQDGTISFGQVATNTFRFVTLDASAYVMLGSMGFGCGFQNKQGRNTGMSGILGLSRFGGISWPEQVSHAIGASYGFCLPIAGSREDSGYLVLGDDGMPAPGGAYNAVNFAAGGKGEYFYLDAVDMMLGGVGVGVPAGTFDFNQDKTGGLMMDTGTMISDFKPGAYTVFRDAYRSAMFPLLGPVKFPGKLGLDTCWDVTNIVIETLPLPNMGFMLRNGQQFIFSRIASYFTYYSRSKRPVFCLPMIPYDDTLNKWSIFGAYQMMQTHMNFDTANNRLVWRSNAC